MKQMCGIWRRLFDSDCCINSASIPSSRTVYVRMYIGVLMRMFNVHVYLCVIVL